MWLVGSDVRGPRTPKWSGMNPRHCWTRGSSLLLPTLLYRGSRGCSKGRTTITGRRSCPLHREPVSCKMLSRVSKSRGIVLFRTTHQAYGLINVYVGDSAEMLLHCSAPCRGQSAGWKHGGPAGLEPWKFVDIPQENLIFTGVYTHQPNRSRFSSNSESTH